MTDHNSVDSDTATPTSAGESADTRNPDWDSYVTHGHGDSDEQIRADVQQVMTEHSESIGESTTGLAVSVSGGVVTLEGGVASEDAHEQLIAIIRAVPSVRDVQSALQIAAP